MIKGQRKKENLPVHSLEYSSKQITILPLDYTNPYDYKREHRHTYYEILFIKNGGCNQLIDFKNYSGLDYSGYIVHPQQVHLMNRNNSAGVIIQFTDERINATDLRAQLKALAYRDQAAILFENQIDRYKVFMQLLDIMRGYIQSDMETKNQVITTLLQAIIAMIIDLSRKNALPTSEQDKQLMIEFNALLEANYKNQSTVNFYTSRLNVTDKKLASTTKKYTGLSPLQVIHNRILLEAKRLLLFDDVSQKEIGYTLGFDSPASFSAFIKNKTGLPPSEIAIQLKHIYK